MKHEIKLDITSFSEVSEELYQLLHEAFAKKAEKYGLDFEEFDNQEWTIMCEGEVS